MSEPNPKLVSGDLLNSSFLSLVDSLLQNIKVSRQRGEIKLGAGDYPTQPFSPKLNKPTTVTCFLVTDVFIVGC